ncbi:unnamed protein product [Brassicogethes aeneus]|uniref:Uncharacterized protein n=1 Tax=Brassicogethes aeneus TaxID=1431903 RepID=A0A9P0B4M5_BRAAE|nr:unnamed protein product [Brassicogethes aeneus]
MYLLNTIAILFLISSLVLVVIGKYFILGPSGIIIHKAEPCKEYKNLPIQAELRFRMINKTTQVLDGHVFAPFVLENDVGLRLKCGKKEKNNVKQNAFTLEDNHLCETLNRYVGPLWWDVQKQIGMEPEKCPIKKGNYNISGLYLDLSKMKVQMILEGVFLTRIQFTRKTKTIFCMDFELETFKRD